MTVVTDRQGVDVRALGSIVRVELKTADAPSGIVATIEFAAACYGGQ
jgi:hypothetical protein